MGDGNLSQKDRIILAICAVAASLIMLLYH